MKPITYSELMKEIDKYERKANNKRFITKQQYVFAIKARKKKMTWPDIMRLWNRAGWEKIHPITLSKLISQKCIKD